MKRSWCKIIKEVKETSKTFGACYSIELTSYYKLQGHTLLNFIQDTDKYCG
jgi:hypothetical protein